MAIPILQPRSAEDWCQARKLIEQYAASLELDPSFQNLQGKPKSTRSTYRRSRPKPATRPAKVLADKLTLKVVPGRGATALRFVPIAAQARPWQPREWIRSLLATMVP
jgi:hypothetical protein